MNCTQCLARGNERKKERKKEGEEDRKEERKKLAFPVNRSQYIQHK